MELLHGVCRKLSIPVLLLAIAGWILFVVGFGLVNSKESVREKLGLNRSTAHEENIPYWVFIISGPIFFLNGFVHLVFARWYTGVMNNFFTAVFLVCGGGVLYRTGLSLFSSSGFNGEYSSLSDPDIGLYPLLEWVGCLASAFFITVHMTMWPTFCNEHSRSPKDQVSPEEVKPSSLPAYSELEEEKEAVELQLTTVTEVEIEKTDEAV